MLNFTNYYGITNQNYNGIPLDSHEDSYNGNEKNKTKQKIPVLVRMWKNWTFHTLLVGLGTEEPAMYTCTSDLQNGKIVSLCCLNH